MSAVQSEQRAGAGRWRGVIGRRSALRVGGLGLLGLHVPGLLKALEEAKGPRPKAKSVIFLFQFGGPSHIDMFDMKPDAPEQVRGPLKPIATSAPGIQICERLPRMARVMDKVTLIRSMHHTMQNHNSASYYALTGHAPPVDDIRLRDSIELYPAYGSIVDRFAPGPADLPTFVAYPHVIRDGSVTPGQHASFLGKGHDPLLFTEDPATPGFRLPQLSLPEGLPLERVGRRRELQALIDRQWKSLEGAAEARGLDALTQKAMSMLASPRLAAAFDLSREPESLRDRYGRHTYGQSLLLARRLVEAGVRVVTVYFSSSIGGQSKTAGGWDTHGFNNTRMFPIIDAYHLPITDQTLPTFLEDLDGRGLLDETLVLWMGEFGRTPRINANESRDHWPRCYTALLAGGGVKRGHVHGASDRDGAFPATAPVRPDDLAATLFHLLGVPHDSPVNDAQGRPLLITEGAPLWDVIA